MARYNHLGVVRNNQLGRVRYNYLARPALPTPLYSRLPGARPVVLDEDGRRLAVMENAYDIVLTQEINGEDTLRFKVPYKDAKRAYLTNERYIHLLNQIYVVRTLTDERDEEGRLVTSAYCEALWYDLQYTGPLAVSEWKDVTADVPMRDILEGTGWQVGTVESTAVRSLILDPNTTNRLAALHQVREVWGGELAFDTAARRVRLLSGQGRRPGIAFAYRKNLRSVQKITDTTQLVTRLYPYGRGGMGIEEANDDVPFLEDYSYSRQVRVWVMKDERFTNPWYLKEFAQALLSQLAKPRVSYVVRAADLSYLSGVSHEDVRLGDVVTVYDEEQGLQVETRIVRWEYRVDEPWDTVLELSSRQPTFGDLFMRTAEAAGSLAVADTVSRSDLLELMVFNYLLNSRADDGFAYWVNNGWEIDNANGVSGPASFLCRGQYGVEKTLSQRVWPSHRPAYTLSFQVATEGLTKGPNGRVGVEVVIRYKDGTTETRFFSLA